MDIEERKKAFLNQLRFRIIVFIISVLILLALYILKCSIDGNLYNILQSIVCSLIAWDLVELFEFITNMESVFKKERYYFFDEVWKYLKPMIKQLGEETDKTDINVFREKFKDKNEHNKNIWEFLYSNIDKLNDFIEHLPGEQKIYILSTEYGNYKIFIQNCFWLLIAHLDIDSIDGTDYTNLCEQFVIEETEENKIKIEDGLKALNSVNDFLIDRDKMRKIKLNNTPIVVPDSVLKIRRRSIINHYGCIDIPKCIKTDKMLLFTPCIEFEKMVLHNYEWYKILYDILGKQQLIKWSIFFIIIVVLCCIA